jgi:dipeptidyl aminopeptidase/acylaminoacyl peptidase
VASVFPSGRGYDCTYPAGQNPAVSPNGRRIAWNLGDQPRDVYAMNANGSARRRLTHSPADTYGSLLAAFSPDSGRILYSVFGSTDTQGVYVMNGDGSGQRRLNQRGQAGSFSPNGATIAFDRQGDGIFLMDAGGGNERLILANRTQFDQGTFTRVYEQQREPHFSPDGRRIVFTRQTATTSCPGFPNCSPKTTIEIDLYVMNANGTGVTRLTSDPGAEEADAWFSPDGTRIAYFRRVRDAPAGEIWVMNADGGGKHKVGEGAEPFWSTVQRGPGPIRLVLDGVPRHCLKRKQLDILNFGIRIRTAASRLTGYTVDRYVDGKFIDETTNDIDRGSGLPIYPFAYVRRGSTHRVKWVVSGRGTEAVARTGKFRRC